MATVTKRGNGYRIRAYAGYRIDGSQIERSMTYKPPAGMTEKAAYKEALRQAILFEEKIKSLDDCDGRIRFADFAELWFQDYADPNLRPRTVARYRELLNRINPVLGHIALENIRPSHLLTFYRNLENEGAASSYKSFVDLKKIIKSKGMTKVQFSELSGASLNTLTNAFQKRPISLESSEKICVALGQPISAYFKPIDEKKKLSPTTIKHHHRLISDILNSAVCWQYIKVNPCSRIPAPKASKTEIVFLDDIQARHFLNLIRKEPGYYRRPIQILLLTGMRRSELLGLEWKDIDWKNSQIHIRRTSHYLPNKGVFTEETKNKSSNRIIFVSSQVLDILREQYLWQTRQSQLPGHTKPDHDRIFTNLKDQPIHPDRLTQWFSRFVKKTDLPQNLHLHSLRHSYATICIAANIPVPAVSAQLGHSSPTTTMGIYTHSIQSSQIAAANQLGTLFSEII